MMRVLSAVCLSASAVVPVSAWPADPVSKTCVDVKIGTAESYSCLNDELAKLIPGRRLSSLDTPYRADGTPSPANGVANRAATAETLGNAFGHSSVAQRPPPAVYPTVLGVPIPSQSRH